MAQQPTTESKSAILKRFINPKKDVPDLQTALAGAMDIVAETWSENTENREWLLEQTLKFGKVNSKIKRGKKSAEGAEKFEQYFDRSESVSRIPGHRVLAMMRGASEGILRVKIGLEGDRELSELKRRLVRDRQFAFFKDLVATVEDCYARLMVPATESVSYTHLTLPTNREV